jgi:hypothetical protein
MEYQKRGIQLSPELWLVKIMVRFHDRHVQSDRVTGGMPMAVQVVKVQGNRT